MTSVLVVGAGPSGLAVTSALRARGVAARLIDRTGKPGGAYTRMVPRMVMVSPARYNSLPGFPLDSVDDHVTAGEYAAYLVAFADHFDLRPEATDLVRLERHAGAYRAQLRSGDQLERAEFDAVVLATGVFSRPRWPAIPGLRGGSAPVVHANEWVTVQDSTANTLVIGAGISGVEIVEDFARRGVPVSISTRQPIRLVLPKKILGRDFHDLTVPFERLPRWLSQGYCRGSYQVPPTDRGFKRFRRDGAIRTLGAVASIEGRDVSFVDGTTERFGLIICATGYEPAALDVIEGLKTKRGLLATTGRACEAVGHPNLYLLGLRCVGSVASEYLRGIGEDAQAVAAAIG